uniref:Uncharacterized protein n=1 Tax=Branchiostoma floridae TaxID=7739 RepID=C3YKI7_BRAFL|eukprot:XP_002603220.1 hypothetical protein BRAFLDRAFT_126976 [Branchiostoma floridae]
MATVGDVLDFCGQHKQLKMKEKMELLKETFSSIDSKAEPKQLWNSVTRVAGRRKKLSKEKKHQKLKSLLKETFNSPKQNQTPQSRAPWTPRKKKLAKHLEEARKANKHLKKKLGSAEEWKNNMQCVQTELETLISEYTSAVQECDKITEDTEEKMKLMNNNNGELEKYIKEIENAFDSQSKKLQDATEKLSKWNQHLSNKVAIAGCRALGILEKRVTTPMWREILAATSILDLNRQSLTMRAEFLRLSEDASELLVPDNKTIFPGREVVDEDDVCHALLKDSEDAELDALTISALELIFSSWVILIEKQLTDYLPGGMYDNPDENLKQKSKHVPTTNVTCERSIGYRNRLHQLKPSAKTLHIESLLLLSTNHTVDWLGKLSEDDKERALETARKAAPGCIKKQKEREQEILSHRLELLRQKQDEKERKIRRVSQEKSKICEAVRQGGGEWKTPEEVEQRLCECATDSKKKEKILAQLRFHKVVLEDPLPTDKRYLVQQQMTVNGSVKKFSMSELKENLLELIGMNTLRCNNNNEEDEDEDSDQEVEQGTKYMAMDRRLELIQAEKAKLKKKRDKQRERL